MNGLRRNAPFDSVDQLAAEAAAAGSQVRLFSVGPLMHGGSQWMLGSSAVAGGVYVLYTQGGFDAGKVLDLVSRAKVNMMNILGNAVARPLADYKVPKTILLVDHVPRTPARKIEYPAVQKMALDLIGQDPREPRGPRADARTQQQHPGA